MRSRRRAHCAMPPDTHEVSDTLIEAVAAYLDEVPVVALNRGPGWTAPSVADPDVPDAPKSYRPDLPLPDYAGDSSLEARITDLSGGNFKQRHCRRSPRLLACQRLSGLTASRCSRSGSWSRGPKKRRRGSRARALSRVRHRLRPADPPRRQNRAYRDSRAARESECFTCVFRCEVGGP